MSRPGGAFPIWLVLTRAVLGGYPSLARPTDIKGQGGVYIRGGEAISRRA